MIEISFSVAAATGVSDTSSLLQLADLFAGSVTRKFNKDGETMNAKDELAEFLQMVAGFDFVKEGEGARSPWGLCSQSLWWLAKPARVSVLSGSG